MKRYLTLIIIKALLCSSGCKAIKSEFSGVLPESMVRSLTERAPRKRATMVPGRVVGKVHVVRFNEEELRIMLDEDGVFPIRLTNGQILMVGKGDPE